MNIKFQRETYLMYTIFDNVVCNSRTDSEIFDDSVELQQFFIKIRDELCKNGEILMSSALNFTLKHLHSDVEQEKREKIPKEIEEDQQKTEEDEIKGSCKCKVYSQNVLSTNFILLMFLMQRNRSTSESATGAVSGRDRGRTSIYPGL